MAGCLGGNPRGRLALLVCNIFLLLGGIGCMAGGIVLVLGRKAYGDSLDWLREIAVGGAADVGFTVDPSALDVTFVTEPLGTAFLVIGSFIVILAIIGIVVSLGPFRKLLFIYVAITSLILVTLVILAICAYAKPSSFQKPAKKALKDALKDFTGIAGNGSTTLGWNAVMMHFNCCGIDSYKDFEASSNWVQEVNGITLVTPIACCEEIDNPPKCAKKNKFEKKTFYDRGCFDPIFHYVATETGLLLFVVYFMLFVEFLCLFFSVLVTCVMVSKTPDKVRVVDFMY